MSSRLQSLHRRPIPTAPTCPGGTRSPWRGAGLPYYEIDDDESKHALELEEFAWEFGHQEVSNAWVLLDEDDEMVA